MAGDRPGPDPLYNEVAQITLRTEGSHMAVYRERAAQLKMPLNRYLAKVLAAAHDLLEDEQPAPAQIQLKLGA
ncbi:hypothetical protein [Amycolatopsis sp. NPDC058986]|uniref:hypothetical protein n=1 Tax=unclassified Amycolatopsis TaxID=2618356 RepID=UPI00366D18ED